MYALPNTPRIQLALALSKVTHAGQIYGNGLDYFEYHIMGVVNTLWHAIYALDTMTDEEKEDALITAILHDAVEDAKKSRVPITLGTVFQLFGNNVGNGVAGVSKLPNESNTEYLVRCKNNIFSKLAKIADSFFNASNALVETRHLRVVYYMAVNSYMRGHIEIDTVPTKPKFKD